MCIRWIAQGTLAVLIFAQSDYTTVYDTRYIGKGENTASAKGTMNFRTTTVASETSVLVPFCCNHKQNSKVCFPSIFPLCSSLSNCVQSMFIWRYKRATNRAWEKRKRTKMPCKTNLRGYLRPLPPPAQQGKSQEATYATTTGTLFCAIVAPNHSFTL